MITTAHAHRRCPIFSHKDHIWHTTSNPIRSNESKQRGHARLQNRLSRKVAGKWHVQVASTISKQPFLELSTRKKYLAKRYVAI